jgi:hypothetical protein
MVFSIWATKASSVRVGPIDGLINRPYAGGKHEPLSFSTLFAPHSVGVLARVYVARREPGARRSVSRTRSRAR